MCTHARFHFGMEHSALAFTRVGVLYTDENEGSATG